MQTIDEAVSNIRRAVYGKDVRESIASALEQAYQDANTSAAMEIADAKKGYPTLKEKLESVDNKVADMAHSVNNVGGLIIVRQSVPETLENGQICIVYEEG